MATQTLQREDVFPVGTSVSAYPLSNWPQSQRPPSGAPVGSPTATATVQAGGVVTLSGLADATNYVAYAASPDRYVQFRTPVAAAATSGSSTALSAAAKAWLPTGAITANFPRWVISSGVAPTSGTMKLAGGMLVLTGSVVSSITMLSTTGATTPTNQWFCIVDRTTRNILATTVDDLTTAWGSNATKTLLLATTIGGSTPGGTWTPSTDQEVYIGAVIVAATPTTLAAAPTSTAGVIFAPVMAGNSTAALTGPASAPATVAAPSAAGIIPWACVS